MLALETGKTRQRYGPYPQVIQHMKDRQKKNGKVCNGSHDRGKPYGL